MDHPDGRDTRWQEHRIERRRALVDSALRAIRTHGSGVTVEEIAVSAGTSKTVLYRYFGDRAGLYMAVADKVASNILTEVRPMFTSLRSGGVEDMVRGLAQAYVGLVDRDPEIYLFVMNRPPGLPAGAGDPATGIADRIAIELTQAVRKEQHTKGTTGGIIEPLAFGIVGFIRAATGQWLAAGAGETTSSDDLVDLIAMTFAPMVTAAVDGVTPTRLIHV
jgi:AcrR family transcriptional regulator